jgi:hypothetical protein
MEEYIINNYMLAVPKERREKQLSCIARLCLGDMKTREGGWLVVREDDYLGTPGSVSIDSLNG